MCSRNVRFRVKLFSISDVKLIYLFNFSIFIIIQIADNQNGQQAFQNHKNESHKSSKDLLNLMAIFRGIRFSRFYFYGTSSGRSGRRRSTTTTTKRQSLRQRKSTLFVISSSEKNVHRNEKCRCLLENIVFFFSRLLWGRKARKSQHRISQPCKLLVSWSRKVLFLHTNLMSRSKKYRKMRKRKR